MTKRDLVVRISNETGVIQQDVLAVVQRTMDILCDSLAQGETIELRNFGVFEVKLRKARVGRNPHMPETDVRIPPRAVVRFKPGKQLRANVLKLSNKILAESNTKTQETAPVSAQPVSSHSH